MLRAELAEQGVTSLPRPRRTSAPLAASYIATILKNPHYTGVVRFEGVEYKGQHEALVTRELFEQCQRIRLGRVASREKPIVRTHYLKGTVFCGQCGSPLSYELSRGRAGGIYQYFYCLGRQARKNGCEFVATQAHVLGSLVENHWSSVQLGDAAVMSIRTIVFDYLDTVVPRRDQRREQGERRLAELQLESDKLMRAHLTDAIDTDQLRREQSRVVAAKVAIERTISESSVKADQLRLSFEHCAALLSSAHDQYLASDDNGRRDLNQGVFRRIYIWDQDIVGADYAPLFQHLLDADLA